MDKTIFTSFCELRSMFRGYCEQLHGALPQLLVLQRQILFNKGAPSYSIETPVVYNEEWDTISQDDEIRLILVADNPGKKEQERVNRRYLVGPSGKLLERFVTSHPELGIRSRKNILILNKTPIHTPRTTDLKILSHDPEVAPFFVESQRTMATLTYQLQLLFPGCPLWIIGYSEMKRGKLFWPYTAQLQELYLQNPRPYEDLFLFRHFSMNQFTIDVTRHRQRQESLSQVLQRIGKAYRDAIFYPLLTTKG